MKTVQSEIPFSYKTIRVTRSRIEKGLLAIPVSFIDRFPKHRGSVRIFFGTSKRALSRVYTPYTSSSRECRIGGMADFFKRNQVQDGDEIVVQFLDENTYRIMAEKQFQQSVRDLECSFDGSQNEKEASGQIAALSEITNLNPKDAILGEYYRLSLTEVSGREYTPPHKSRNREAVAPSVRRLLAEIYGGRCQVTGFGFLTRKGEPYFETHHIKPDIGDHLKNVLVVCPNVHAQFAHASVEESFDQEGWLRKVKLNDTDYDVFHIIDTIPSFTKEIHSYDGSD